MLNYFNNAATSFPKPDIVERAVSDFFKQPPLNSSRSCNCIKKENDVDVVCKKKIRDFLNINENYELILTPGATYSANIAINAISKKLDEPVLITNSWCHNCIMRNHFARIGTSPMLLDDFNEIPDILDNNYYVAITHQNNVDGNIIDDETITNIINKCSKYNIPIVLDVTQSIGSHPIDISKYNYDNLFVFASLHKGMYSVPGIGFLTIPKDYVDYKWMYGSNGGIDGINYKETKSFEVGTPNELAMASAIAGIDYVNTTGLRKITLNKESLCNYFLKLWYSNNINVMRNCFKLNKCYPKSGIISLSPLYTQKCYEIVQDLTQKYDIICRYGYHCSPIYHFNVLKCNTTLRFSFGYFNTKNEIDHLFELFEVLV